MSRWFRHYAGMSRDDKLVRAAVKARQPVERAVWVYGAILESAAEINDAGRYDFDVDEAAYFLRCEPDDLSSIVLQLVAVGYLSKDRVTWSGFRSGDEYERTPLPAVLRAAILSRDGERCRYCGDFDGPFQIDHIWPVALGGTDDPENLCVACRSCNASKGAKPLEVWLQ